ncbi:unnamed protein product [Vitrella brassicaformis CCMP3155]|uniref:HTH CENPB-type domain-containing protein n=2 Tax=Vitrella brassicaformis TaxID=1169539 RepID=A0A0G4EMD4_VITBC|nr:unnamed protein product [Vitrella brassicaformis CCMP3155]|eukprot:CEL98155.1 unnamed protein product [Vitrella brassicaformis CCMP3155]
MARLGESSGGIVGVSSVPIDTYPSCHVGKHFCKICGDGRDCYGRDCPRAPHCPDRIRHLSRSASSGYDGKYSDACTKPNTTQTGGECANGQATTTCAPPSVNGTLPAGFGQPDGPGGLPLQQESTEAPAVHGNVSAGDAHTADELQHGHADAPMHPHSAAGENLPSEAPVDASVRVCMSALGEWVHRGGEWVHRGESLPPSRQSAPPTTQHTSKVTTERAGEVTLGERLLLVDEFKQRKRAGQDVSMVRFAHEKGVGVRSFERWHSAITKQREAGMPLTDPTKKRSRRPKYQEIEDQLVNWMAFQRPSAGSTGVSPKAVRAKAMEIAGRLGVDAFSASNSWMAGFKKRYQQSVQLNGQPAAAAAAADADSGTDGITMKEEEDFTHTNHLPFTHTNHLPEGCGPCPSSVAPFPACGSTPLVAGSAAPATEQPICPFFPDPPAPPLPGSQQSDSLEGALMQQTPAPAAPAAPAQSHHTASFGAEFATAAAPAAAAPASPEQTYNTHRFNEPRKRPASSTNRQSSMGAPEGQPAAAAADVETSDVHMGGEGDAGRGSKPSGGNTMSMVQSTAQIEPPMKIHRDDTRSHREARPSVVLFDPLVKSAATVDDRLSAVQEVALTVDDHLSSLLQDEDDGTLLPEGTAPETVSTGSPTNEGDRDTPQQTHVIADSSLSADEWISLRNCLIQYLERAGPTQQDSPTRLRELRCQLPALRALLLYALTSLYEDQIHPFFCDIERRLQELQAPPVVEKHFLALYSLMPAVYEVTPAPHDNTATTRDSPFVRPFPFPSPSTRVYLRSEHIPCGFRGWVDQKSSVNPYPERVWRQLSDYLCALLRDGGCGRGEATGELAYQFKGGRYGMAMELKKRSLHWTNEWTLGEMCHIVQLAITKGLLAYENNILQPVAVCKGIASAVLEVTPRTQAQPTSPTTPTSPGFPSTTITTSDCLADECDGRGGRGGGAACLKDVELAKECISISQGILRRQFKRRVKVDEVCRVYKNRDNRVTIHATNYIPEPGMEPLTPLTARGCGPCPSSVAPFPACGSTPLVAGSAAPATEQPIYPPHRRLSADPHSTLLTPSLGSQQSDPLEGAGMQQPPGAGVLFTAQEQMHDEDAADMVDGSFVSRQDRPALCGHSSGGQVCPVSSEQMSMAASTAWSWRPPDPPFCFLDHPPLALEPRCGDPPSPMCGDPPSPSAYRTRSLTSGAWPIFTRLSVLFALRHHWNTIELDRIRCPSLADPRDTSAPAEDRHVWLTAASAESIMGAEGWDISLLPAAIDADARRLPLRHLYRLQVFRKPAKYLYERATKYDDQCSVRVYRGGQLVEAIRYVPVGKGDDDKRCATCVMPRDGGGVCGRHTLPQNMVIVHLQRTHGRKLLTEAQGLHAPSGPCVDDGRPNDCASIGSSPEPAVTNNQQPRRDGEESTSSPYVDATGIPTPFDRPLAVSTLIAGGEPPAEQSVAAGGPVTHDGPFCPMQEVVPWPPSLPSSQRPDEVPWADETLVDSFFLPKQNEERFDAQICRSIGAMAAVASSSSAAGSRPQTPQLLSRRGPQCYEEGTRVWMVSTVAKRGMALAEVYRVQPTEGGTVVYMREVGGTELFQKVVPHNQTQTPPYQQLGPDGDGKLFRCTHREGVVNSGETNAGAQPSKSVCVGDGNKRARVAANPAAAAGGAVEDGDAEQQQRIETICSLVMEFLPLHVLIPLSLWLAKSTKQMWEQVGPATHGSSSTAPPRTTSTAGDRRPRAAPFGSGSLSITSSG